MDGTSKKVGEQGEYIWLRYATQFRVADRTQTIEIGIPVPIGASAETRELLMREANEGMDQLTQHVERRVAQMLQRAQPAQTAPVQSQPKPSAPPPKPATAPTRVAEKPASIPDAEVPIAPVAPASRPAPPATTAPVSPPAVRSRETAPAPRAAASPEVVVPPTRPGISMASSPTGTNDTNSDMDLPQFIQYIRETWSLDPKQAMGLLKVTSLNTINRRSAVKWLERHFAQKSAQSPNTSNPGEPAPRAPEARPAPQTAPTRPAEPQVKREPSRSAEPQRSAPSQPNNPQRGPSNVATSAPQVSQGSSTRESSAVPPMGASGPDKPSGVVSQTRPRLAPPTPNPPTAPTAAPTVRSASTPPSAPSSPASPPRANQRPPAIVRDERPTYGFDEEDDPNDVDELDDLEDLDEPETTGLSAQDRLRASRRVDSLRNIGGSSPASPERLKALNNMIEGQITTKQLLDLAKGIWGATILKKLKIEQVEALISWAREDEFADDVDLVLKSLEEE